MTSTAAGIVLAAGAGVRMGSPKSLLVDPDRGPWLASARGVMCEAGLAPVVVVLGAAPEAASLLHVAGAASDVVVARDWRDGIDASLAAGLRHLADGTTYEAITTAVVTLVDLRDVTAAVVRRVVERVGTDAGAAGRATYAGRPGHPVVLGRDHWAAAPSARRALLAGPDAVTVDCGDLASGVDADRPGDLAPGTRRLDRTTGVLVDDLADLPGTNRP